jgi:chromate transporter
MRRASDDYQRAHSERRGISAGMDVSGSKPTATELFLIFTRIGLTSFGGGLSGWLYREFVQKHRWLSEEEFLSGLAICQTLPGINVSNLAIWIGYRLLGATGAIASLIGIIVPPAIVIILLAMVFTSLTKIHLVHLALIGASAAAIGLSLSMGLTAARRLPRKVLPLTISAATFAAIGIFHLPLVWVVLVGGTTSIALSLLTHRS